jgi:hypothetical protein
MLNSSRTPKPAPKMSAPPKSKHIANFPYFISISARIASPKPFRHSTSQRGSGNATQSAIQCSLQEVVCQKTANGTSDSAAHRTSDHSGVRISHTGLSQISRHDPSDQSPNHVAFQCTA